MATADFYRNQDANDTLVNSYYDADGYFPSETEWQYEHPSKSFYGWCKSRDGKGTLYQPNTTERFEDGESYYAIWLDLTGTIWEFKSSGLDLDNHPDYYSWQFESNGNTYAELSTHTWDIEGEYTLFYEGTKVYDVENGGWTNEAYRTITITSMDYPNDAKSELEFLRNNATRIIPPTPYMTTDTELTSIADAIRAKGGTSAPLVYPAGFVSAINDISSGGGGATHVTSTATIANYVYLDEDGSAQTFSADPFTTLSVDALSGSIIVGYSRAHSVSKMQPTNTTLVASSTGGAGNTAYLGIYQVD